MSLLVLSMISWNHDAGVHLWSAYAGSLFGVDGKPNLHVPRCSYVA